MTIELPLWMQNLDYEARLHRLLLASTTDAGVLGLASLVPTERAAGANMSVELSAGKAICDGANRDVDGAYLFSSTATETVPITAAPGTDQRIDIIVVQMNDTVAGVGTPTDTATLISIPGVVSSTPSAPPVPPGAELIAEIGPITPATSSITTALITDRRRVSGRRTTPGTIEFTAADKIPTGWLEADGAAVSRTEYPDLFAAIGTTYGAGNGSSTFNLPDLSGRVPVAPGGGLGSPGTEAGAETITPSASQLPGHTHTIPAHGHTQSSHSHTIGSHTHSITHNHPAATTSSDTHNHTSTQNQSTLLDRQDPGQGGTIDLMAHPTNAFSTSSDSHSHTFDVPSYSGSSGSGGGGSTSSTAPSINNKTAFNTQSTGSGNPINVMNPHTVVGRALIRT